MKILVHSCCAPCSVYPLKRLKGHFNDIEFLFYNPNIHPYTEYKLRLDALKQFTKDESLILHIPEEYDLNPFFRAVVFNVTARCHYCYDLRLSSCAKFAQENGFEAFTTTLLYSTYQNHEHIIKLAEKYADQYNLQFYYEDFRQGWQHGIDESIERNMYRQKYCGCLYSEQERFDNRWKKRQIKLLKAQKS